jgi:ankyrin repeat protein
MYRHTLSISIILGSTLATIASSAPIHDAAREGRLEDVRRILAATPAAAIERDAGGFLPIVYAAFAGSTEIVRMLIEHGADPEATSGRDKVRALHMAAAGGRVAVIRELHARAVGLDARDSNEGLAAIHYATLFGNADAVATLLEVGADGDVTNKRGGRAIEAACEQANLPIVRMLIEKYSHPNRITPNGNSLLHIAIRTGSLELVQLLLAAGADPHVEDSFGRSAAAFARSDGTEAMIEALGGH